jgi:hypothetical protein
MPKDNPVPVINQTYRPEVPIAELTPHPANPNQGDVGLVGSLFEANGFGGCVLAQESTGLIIDGETRWRAARDKGMTTIPVMFLDVDDDTRDRLLASINESTRAGRDDDSKLLALLQGLGATPRGLDGTAHDGDDIDDLLYKLREQESEPPGDTSDGSGSGVVDYTLRLTPDALEEATRHIEDIRGLLADPSLSVEDIILTALRVMSCTLNDQPDQAEEVAKHGETQG